MTIEQMRAAAGLGPEATDAEVIAAYSALATDQIFPITVEQVRVHLRYDRDDDSNDEHILDLLSRAVGWVESHTGQIMTARDVVEQFDSLDRVRLRAWPVKPDATLFVTYQDSETAIPLPARLSAIRRPAEVLPFIGARWPRLAAGTPITVTIRAGYEPTETIPGNLRTAILVMVTAYDEDREGGDVFMKAVKTATGLCRDFRSYRL